MCENIFNDFFLFNEQDKEAANPRWDEIFIVLSHVWLASPKALYRAVAELFTTFLI